MGTAYDIKMIGNTYGCSDAYDFDWESEEDVGSDTPRTTPNVPKVGRNEICPCGSGKKFKNCCGRSTP